MKKIVLYSLLIGLLALAGQNSYGDNSTNATADFNALIAKVNAKLQQGQSSASDLADEIKQFDALYARFKVQNKDVAAEIMTAKAKLFEEVLYDPLKASEALQRIKTDLPDAPIAAHLDEILAALQKPIAAEKIRLALAVGTQFPEFEVQDLSGKPLTLAQHKGKVVLIDFWATWCPPCVREVPNIVKIYEKYHAQGFDVIGVSLDDDQPQLERFIKERQMAWPQFFDGKGRDNQLALKFGADAPPNFYLLDRTGKIIATDRIPDTMGQLRGDDLEKAVAAAVARK